MCTFLIHLWIQAMELACARCLIILYQYDSRSLFDYTIYIGRVDMTCIFHYLRLLLFPKLTSRIIFIFYEVL